MEKKKKIIISVLAVVIAVSAIGGGIAIKKYKANKAKQESSVTEVTKKTDTVSQKITFDGTIAYDDEVEYYAESSGDHKQISKVLVEQGDIVKKGQILIEYNRDEYNDLLDDLKTAKLELAVLQEDLKNYQTSDKTEILSLDNSILTNDNSIKEYEATIKNNENTIALKQSQLSVLEATLKQDKELLEKGYKSSTDVKSSENTIKEYKDSIAQLKETNSNLKRSISLSDSAKKLNSEKLKLQKNTSLDKTIAYNMKVKKLSIEKQKIVIAAYEEEIKTFQRQTIAKDDGVVTEVNASDNETVDVGASVITVANNAKLIINADVSEYEVNKIAIGDKATVTGDGFEKTYTATVTKILPVGGTDDDDNVVVPIELAVDMANVSETIRNNYTVSVTIDKTPKSKSTLLPVSSIVKDNAGNSYVYIKDATTGKPVKKQIKTGEIKGTEVEVIGLSTTEQVVEVKESTTKKDDPSLMGAPMGGEGGPPPGGGGGPR